jgi:hypothetical protein
MAIGEALTCRASGEKKVIAFNLSGHGHFDAPALAQSQQDKRGASVMAYEADRYGQLEDYAKRTRPKRWTRRHLHLRPLRECRCDASAEGAGHGIVP